MSHGGKSFIACLASLAIGGLAAIASTAPPVRAAVPHPSGVVINEVYGGGGNTGAVYTHDYIELFNGGTTAVPLSGWSLQYRSATNAGTAPFGGVNALSGTVQPGAHFVIQLASQPPTPAGIALPTPDLVVSTSPINLSGTAGVILLADTTTAQTCAVGGTACAALAATVDVVGFGTANTFATAAAPAPSNSTSVSRSLTHANTGSNAADFTAGPPSPGTAGVVVPPPDEFTGSIAEIQGTGAATPVAGDLATTQGVVTAAYPTGGFSGFVIQTEGTGGGDPTAGAASDGIFVYSPAVQVTVVPGDFVEVTGLVSEFAGLTEITVDSADDIVALPDTPLPVVPVAAAWPTTDAARESIESMLFAPTGPFTVSNTFNANNFAEVGLAAGSTPLRTPTDAARPGPAAQAVAADNAARRVTLDDGTTINYLSAANTGLTPPHISLTAPLRVGSTATIATNVIVDYRNNAWKFQPLSPITDATDDAFVTFSNTRVAGPDAAALGAGPLKVASFNVLNYFTTLGANVTGCTSFNDRTGAPITVNNCPGNGPRGAWDAMNLARQQAKIVKAINALDADVVGLMEIENSFVVSGTKDAALATLVSALNTDAGIPGLWALVPSSAQLPAASEMDVIANAIIYKPATVALVGESLALGTESGANQAFDNAREPLGQVFSPVGGGDPFLVVVNHFKSKGSAGPWPGDVDAGDGQGASNESRVRQATALRDWVAGVQTAAAVDDVFLVGDFNAYTFEDPLQILYDVGYVDVNEEAGNLKQSYNFSGENGSLDHILANAGAWARATGSDIWNVNAPESIALEYSRYNYHGTLFYAPDAYRSSDHDPVIVAITTGDSNPPMPPVAPAIGTLDPARILDTRVGGATVDDLFEGIGIRAAGSTLVLDVAGRGGVPADAKGVVLNVTATDATGPGYVTIWPCDAARPTASSVNFDASVPSPNTVLGALAADGTICLYVAEAGVQLIADVNGYIAPDSPFQPINPARLADSRDGAITSDGQFLGGGPRMPGSTWMIEVAGRGGVPVDAETAAFNITVTGGSATGYLTVWSCDTPLPLASTVNYLAGQTVPNAVTSALSANGNLCVYVAEASTHVIVDVNGFYGAGSGYGALDPARLLETRNAPTIDGEFRNLGIRAPGAVLELQVAGRGGVPADATGAVLNVTATDGSGTGYVTAWPCGGPPPNSSTVNFVAGAPRANAAISKLSPGGTVCLVVQEASVQLIVDVNGHL